MIYVSIANVTKNIYSLGIIPNLGVLVTFLSAKTTQFRCFTVIY